jgi:hypothetical protein
VTRLFYNQCSEMLSVEYRTDESLRNRFGSRWTEEPSEIASATLVEVIRGFSGKINTANGLDLEGKVKFDEWRERLEELSHGEVSAC